MRTRLTGYLLLSVLVTFLTSSPAPGQDRGQGAGAQGAGRGGGGRGGLAMLTVTSTSFADGAEIPAKYAGAQGVSPQLSWSGAPAGTASFVLIMHDVDVAIPAGNLHNDITHWVVWNVPASATSIPEGGPVPSGAAQVSMRGPQYMGPAPPAGHPYHHYIFEVFALNATLDVAAGATRADVEKAMEGKILARGAYVGRARPAQ
ncbi:MAG TPA: YbhB/YbcL family Raf kinase inhibitor-like protein [Vicinamibacterales bacterium]|nr:YbhB/YbcL family Raf kinase inhibitor-like protein [Vicinamibacterales bacterium]